MSTPTKTGMKTSKHRRLLTVFSLALFVVGLDQVTKQLAVAQLYPGQRVEVIPGVLWWRLAFNDGAAFSIGSGVTWVFTLISLTAVTALIVLAPRVKNLKWAVVTGSVLGGAAGNLLDRLFRDPGFANGHVVDFIQLPMNFATFNIADSFLVVGICTAAVFSFRGEPLGGHVRN